MFIFLNERVVPAEEALLSVFDHGFLYGDGIYETMRAYGGKVFRLEEHLRRLERSASLIRLSLPDKGFLRDAVLGTIAANKLAEAYVRLTVSRGRGPIGLDPDLCPAPTVVVIAERFSEYPDSLYRDGVRLIIAETRRNLPAALNPRIKSLNFLNNILAKIEAKDRGAYEAIMLNADGYLTEGTVSNIFFVNDGVLCTPSPDAGVLDGITREIVINLARSKGIPVKEDLFLPTDLFHASEVFFTNTTSEVMPVSAVELFSYPVGELTRELGRLYREEVRRDLSSSVR